MVHEVVAEMPGTVWSVDSTVGDRVEADQVLLWLESMKMEIPVLPATCGVIAAVCVGVGDVVHEGDVLLRLHRDS